MTPVGAIVIFMAIAPTYFVFTHFNTCFYSFEHLYLLISTLVFTHFDTCLPLLFP